MKNYKPAFKIKQVYLPLLSIQSIIQLPQSRREFIKLSAGCALLVAIGGTAFLQSCTIAKVYKTEAKNGEYKIPLSEFLLDKMRLVRAKGLDYDILVVKKSEKEYIALYLECTHRQSA